jgi:hypothetical protein
VPPGKLDPDGDGQDLERADLAAAVTAVVGPVGLGGLPPEQTGHLLVQRRLVAFDGQNPVRAPFGEVGDVVALAVQSVCGDHDTAQVADLIEHGVEAGDLVGVGIDVRGRQYNTGRLVGGGQDVAGWPVAGA